MALRGWISILLATAASAQHFALPDRPEGAFSWIQPANTTILGQYGESEPIYPSPRISGRGGLEEALEKARAFVSELTLEEKAQMVTGVPGPCTGNIYPIPRVNFTGLCLQDGPAALRNADLVSVFPAGVTIASTWDKQMIYDRSLAMGREFKAKGAHIALAPAVGPLGRSAYSGRNWEGFSPDPYLSGVAMGESVRGLQDGGVQATAKHYIANEQEILRNPVIGGDGGWSFESVSSNLDDRTMHEVYLWPFANAVRENAAAMMCSYQRINGSYGCQNSKTLNGLLKTELGFQGYVMSDWFATHSGVASIESGLDMDMPGNVLMKVTLPDGSGYNSFFGGNVTLGVNNGTIATERLDDMIERIMTPYYWLHQDDEFPSIDPSSERMKTFSPDGEYFRDWSQVVTPPVSRDVRDGHNEIIRKHAAAATVLLKNERNALPLRSPKTVYVYGNDAGDVADGPLNQDKFEFGTLAIGGGSGAARFTTRISPLEALRARVAEDEGQVQYWLNNTWVASNDVSQQFPPVEPDVCLVFLKSWATEGWDRETLDLDWHANEVVESVANVCGNTVVVTHSGGINVLPFADHANVTAILAAHYPGEESGNSIVDVLYGDVNPSGRLPYTVAFEAADYDFAPITTGVTTDGREDWQSWFDEGLEIDYRHFDAQNVSVRYEFGFGLSYTTFAASDLNIRKTNSTGEITAAPREQDIQPGGNPDLWKTLFEAKVTLHNTGHVSGAAVAQLYLTFPDSAPEGTPARQLRGFDKVELGACKKGQAHFELMRRDISYWDVVSQQWVIPAGEFTVSVGFSSRDLAEVATFTAISP